MPDRAALIGIDWGTSSCRAVLMDEQGDTLATRASATGILAVPGGNFEAHLDTMVGDWLASSPGLPILASGMITSRNGWVETPYLPLPLTAATLAEALSGHKTARGRLVHFVTGASRGTDRGRPDVMRGEETELIGHLAAQGTQDGLFVMPGTHSKWARVEGGAITDFETCMTGEVFALLKSHSILGKLMQEGGPADDAAFRLGVEAACEGQGSLLGRLFSARSLALFDLLPATGIEEYLSGLLIGDEFAGAMQRHPRLREITVIGRDDLARRYGEAAGMFGLSARVAEPGLAARGQWEIARRARLVAC